MAEEKICEVREAVADPGPLGLACFALTTFCLSLINAGIVSKQSLGVVIALALVYGGTVQILAGMWEFKKAGKCRGAWSGLRCRPGLFFEL